MKIRTWSGLMAFVVLLVGCTTVSQPMSPTVTPVFQTVGSTSVDTAKSPSTPTGEVSALLSTPTVVPSPTTKQFPTPTPSLPTASPTPGIVDAAGAEAADRRFYDAIAGKDRNGYIDSLDPAIRARPDLTVLLGAAVKASTGVDVDVTNIGFRDLRFQTIQSDGTWAIVHTTGYVRLLTYGMETPADGIDILHKVQGKWYVSSIDQAQAALAQTQRDAQATAVAERDIQTMRDIDKVISDGDKYIAAATLRDILLRHPKNEAATAKLFALSSQVPGGVLAIRGGGPGYYTSNSSGQTYLAYASDPNGVYYPIASTSTPVPIRNVSSDLYHADYGEQDYISADGRQFIFQPCILGQPGKHEFRIADIGSGRLTTVFAPGPKDCPAPMSRDGKWLMTGNTALPSVPLLVADSGRLNGEKVCDLTKKQADSYGGFAWSPDGYEFLMRGSSSDSSVSSKVLVGDILAKTCRDVSLPGLTSDTMVVPIPDHGGFWIITPAQFLTANPQGKGITKLVDLPQDLSRWMKGRGLGSFHVIGPKDGSVVFIEGYLIGPKTGRVQPFLEMSSSGQMVHVAARIWLDQGLPKTTPPTLTVSPTSGPRGTRFGFALANAPPGQEMFWRVSPLVLTGPKPFAVVTGRGTTGSDGSLSDSGQDKGFGTVAALNWTSGRYLVEVLFGGGSQATEPIATAEFTVTE